MALKKQKYKKYLNLILLGLLILRGGLLMAQSDNFEKTNHYVQQTRNLADLGRIKQEQHNFAEAIELYSQALTVYSLQLNTDEAYQNRPLKAAILERMVVILSQQKQFEVAEIYGLEALDLCEQMGDKNTRETTEISVGNLFFLQKKYDEAQLHYQKAQDLAKESGHNTGTILDNLGLLATSMGNRDQAIGYFTAAIEQHKNINAQSAIAQTQIQMANLFNDKGDFAQAIQQAKEGTETIARLKSVSGMVEGYETLITAYIKAGNLSKALETQRRFVGLKDSLFANNRRKEIIEAQTKFETEKKDKEIQILSRESRVRALELQQKNLDLINQKLLTERNADAIQLLLQTKELQETKIARTAAELENEKQVVETNKTQLTVYQQNIKIKEQEAIVQSKNNALLRGGTFVRCFIGFDGLVVPTLS
jgi:tetratricopeptide (TPR) repeat protein